MRTLTTHSMVRVVLVSVNFLVRRVLLLLVLLLLIMLSLVFVILTMRGAQKPGSGPSCLDLANSLAMATIEIALQQPVTPPTGRANRLVCRALVQNAVEQAVLTAVQVQKCFTRPCGTLLMITTMTPTRLDEFCAQLQSLGQCRRLSDEEHTKKTRQDAELREHHDKVASQMLTATEGRNVVNALATIRGTSGNVREREKFADLGMEVIASGQRLANSSRKRKLSDATTLDNENDEA